MTHVVSALFVGVAGLFMGQTTSPPSLQDIVAHVLKATTSQCRYTTSVTQNVTSGTGVKTKTSFVAQWDTEGGLTVKRDSLKVLEPSDSASQSGSSVQVAVDIPKYLRDMLKRPEVSVKADSREGKSCWILTDQDKQGVSGQLWVDAERWCVTRLLLDIKDRRYAEADFEYKRMNEGQTSSDNGVGDCWLLSKMVLKNVFDGSCVEQEFSDYTFAHR